MDNCLMCNIEINKNEFLCFVCLTNLLKLKQQTTKPQNIRFDN